ncbi:MAG: zinc ribbon domain-containing protein [Candidatus Pacebacteria bacterium]|nr:zinc ribbon domain-containing protein [Candidatus Paceibacterota bacterium]
MKCTNCGDEITEGKKFCAGCGAKVVIAPDNSEIVKNLNERVEKLEKIAEEREKKINEYKERIKKEREDAGKRKSGGLLDIF